MHLKISSAKWRQFCPVGDDLCLVMLLEMEGLDKFLQTKIILYLSQFLRSMYTPWKK